MPTRREFLVQNGFGSFVLPGWSSLAQSPARQAASAAKSRSRTSPPPITHPILFNTPEADRILEGLQVFPPDDPWNQEISRWPVHPNSRNIIASIGADKPLRYNPDMNFVLVPLDQKRVNVKITGYPDESDPGPFPVPDNMPIEGWPAADRGSHNPRGATLDEVQRDIRHKGGDRHAIVVDPAAGRLYEFYTARKTSAGWEAAQASIFDLKTNRLRPEGWTSTDAAGLPIFPSIVRNDELARGVIGHALRVTVVKSRRVYVYPARHFASRNNNPHLPRMGERIRLRNDYDISGFSHDVKIILTALKHHGMFVADNGLDWAISVAPDERIGNLHEELRRVKGEAFEVVFDPRRGQGQRS
jgi:hypothetical protein